jgi:ABC-type glycerol-3-phosphate transport system substrate-binding protein
MYEKPESIAKQWGAFKDNIVALGSFELSMREQPLEIDYLLINTPGAELPIAKAGFFQQLFHEIKAFLASFFEDYDSIGEVYEGEAIDVWILADGANITSMNGSGRDQATVIKNLVDNYFVLESKIPVNVKLVNKDVLLSATLAGRGPDVALNVAGKEPVNYALRNAVVDLTQFEDFDEVKGWFLKDAFTQFTFEEGIYGLPQTMSFHVMFYRADILKDLGLAIPNTWDEFYEALAVIQKNNMNVGVFPDWTTYAMFLYQHGGEYYKDGGKASGLDTEAAITAFQQWSGNYVNYDLPVTFDFANRFRTGEMPLSIGDYTNYNYLSVFAPEIKGLWGFTKVPGYVNEQGEIDHSVSTWESASVIMATSDQQEDAWKFLKWWMSTPTQTAYGNDIENVLGVAGRVATANIDALKNLPWSNTDYRQLVAQLDWVRALPEVPGGYFTERHIKNAFYTVFSNNEDPRETLQDYVKTINNEIENKRKEFGLDTGKNE